MNRKFLQIYLDTDNTLSGYLIIERPPLTFIPLHFYGREPNFLVGSSISVWIILK